MDSGAAAVRVPKPGKKVFDKPIPLTEAPAPLQAVRSASGLWMGSGRLAGDVGVKSATTTLVANGPVFAEVRSDYELTAGRYTITIRVVAGQDVVLVSDEFDTTDQAKHNAWLEFSFNEGLNPTRVGAIAHWGTVPQNRKDLKSLDRFSHEMTLVDYELEFNSDRRELSVMGYVPWWPDSVNSVTLHGPDVVDTLSFFPRRIGQWRNPMGSYLQVRKSGKVFLQLPLYIDQEWTRDGIDLTSPYNSGILEESWPKSACRRKWAFSFSTKDKVFQGEGRSSLAKDIARYGTLPLNKIKDWTLEWDSAGVTYPRLYTTAEQLPALRKRVFANPEWTKDLGQYHNRPQSYLLTGDPNIGDELLHDKTEGAWFNTWGALPGLRLYVSMLFDGWSYVGHYAPNQARPMMEFIRFDAAMAVAEATDAEREEMRHLAAFVANVVNDQDWHPTKAGWHLGNVNMPPRQEYHHAIAAAVLPNHPKAAEWARRGQAEVKRNLYSMVRPSGAWRECPHYQMDAALFPMSQTAIGLKLLGSYDFFAEEKFKKTTTFMVNILTPPCPRFEVKGESVRLLPAYGNSAWEINPLFGWWAAMTKDDDPEFSKMMMWAWNQQGRPNYYKPGRFIIDPTLPAKQPDLKSAHFDGFGTVLRSGFPSSEETWMTFRHGDCMEHYDYGDQGSFMLYAKGSPLVVQFSSLYRPHFEGAWYYNRANVNHRLATPDDKFVTPAEDVAKFFGGNFDDFAMGTELWSDDTIESYPMHNKAFESFGSADYSRGEQSVEFQGVINKNQTIKRPGNVHFPIVDVPDYKGVRQVLFLKDADPAAPNYFVISDDFISDDPLQGEWNIWTLAKSIDLESTPAVVTGEYGVNLDVYMASPADPQWSTRQESHDFRLSERPKSTKQPWSETLTNLRAKAPAGQGFLAVLYPRKADEKQPTFETIAGGKGVKVVTPRGTDWAFLSTEPIKWQGDGMSFTGTVGTIRKTGEKYEVIFMASGEATVAGQTITATKAMQKTITENPAK